MKAVRVHRFGPPEVLSYEEVSKPEPGGGEVVVEVRRTGAVRWSS